MRSLIRIINKKLLKQNLNIMQLTAVYKSPTLYTNDFNNILEKYLTNDLDSDSNYFVEDININIKGGDIYGTYYLNTVAKNCCVITK